MPLSRSVVHVENSRKTRAEERERSPIQPAITPPRRHGRSRICSNESGRSKIQLGPRPPATGRARAIASSKPFESTSPSSRAHCLWSCETSRRKPEAFWRIDFMISICSRRNSLSFDQSQGDAQYGEDQIRRPRSQRSADPRLMSHGLHGCSQCVVAEGDREDE